MRCHSLAAPLVASLCLLLASTAPARAQGVAITQAEALYNQGKDLVEKKRYHEACDKFSASLKLDETVNTHVALARCLELDGRAASAWGEYLVAAKKGAGTPAGQYAADQAKGLEKKLLKATLRMARAPKDLTLTLDDGPLPRESLNAELPLDPGEHVLVAKAAGKRPLTKRFSLDAGSSPMTVSLDLEDLSTEEIEKEKAPQKVVVEKVGPAANEWSTMKTTGLVLGLVGVGAAIGAGTFGFLTLRETGLEGDPVKDCGSAYNPNDQSTCTEYWKHHNLASTFEVAAIGAGVGAGVLIGLGATLFVVGGNKPAGGDKDAGATARTRIVPVLTPTLAGLGVGGTF